jgi:hypothetical protein
MARGISLHIGVNEVDLMHYAGVSRRLFSSERDAQAMRHIAERSGFDALPLLLGDRATYAAVLATIAGAASQVGAGDSFLISFAGHGSQVPDVTGTEPDGRNETWCLYDQQLVEQQLFAALRAFERGVRVLIVSDCCHSGIEPEAGFTGRPAPPALTPRELPRDAADAVYRAHAPTYDSQERLGGPDRRRGALSASVLLLASCRADELSYEGTVLGFFTDALVQAWEEGTSSDYEALTVRINQLTPAFQTPNLKPISEEDDELDAFRKSLPFSIGA